MSTGSESDPEDMGTGVLEESEEEFISLKAPLASANNNKKLPKQAKEGRHSQRSAANARERARMQVLSKAFSRLKTSLPWVPADTKLSKLDTLRLASSYISHLRQLLQEDVRHTSLGIEHPLNLTWPFVVSVQSEDTGAIPAELRFCGATA
ncbi:hypothetical protein DNTS_032269 [Danionella cerebrum]|uniref:BHLH domain-containing protein n=1 Tax=Danionella cerebrum TaxID=2873325 RepID=A0A553MQL6_9TELE|nr:hypothetical protein DNTS_032269 [Danionella translucida]